MNVEEQLINKPKEQLPKQDFSMEYKLRRIKEMEDATKKMKEEVVTEQKQIQNNNKNEKLYILLYVFHFIEIIGILIIILNLY